MLRGHDPRWSLTVPGMSGALIMGTFEPEHIVLFYFGKSMISKTVFRCLSIEQTDLFPVGAVK
jgi:hypothetical protein